MEVLPFIAVLLFVARFQQAEGLVECMSCKGVPEPHDCKETIICAEHEECSTDFYITPQGNVFYDLGCSSKRVCDVLTRYAPGKKRNTGYVKSKHTGSGQDVGHVKRQNGNLYICQECCNTEHCNMYGCNDPKKLNRTVCYSCPDVVHPSKCDNLDICDIDKQCYTRHFINDMFEERYKLGCEEKKICDIMLKNGVVAGHPKRQFGGFDAIDLCYYCCNTNFCNRKDCIKGLLTSSLKPSTPIASTTMMPTTTRITTPTTQHKTTPQPTTQPSTTTTPTTQHKTTPQPTTQPSTTATPTTQHKTTPKLTTQHKTTPKLTTQPSTTPKLTTQPPTTATSTKQHKTTIKLTTQPSTTAIHTTKHMTTIPVHTTQSPSPTTTQTPTNKHTTKAPTHKHTTPVQQTTRVHHHQHTTKVHNHQNTHAHNHHHTHKTNTPIPSTKIVTNTPSTAPSTHGPTTDVPSTVVTTPAPTTTECYIQSTRSLQSQLTNCSGSTKYCVTYLHNYGNGYREISKGCAGEMECQTALANNLKGPCAVFDENHLYTSDFKCSFCCTKDKCNGRVVPPHETMYSGHVTSTSSTPLASQTECLAKASPSSPEVKQNCSGSTSYCITHLKNYNNGYREVTKGCASKSVCDAAHMDIKKNHDQCSYFDENFLHKADFQCSYCCAKDLCNTRILPSHETLYQP